MGRCGSRVPPTGRGLVADLGSREPLDHFVPRVARRRRAGAGWIRCVDPSATRPAAQSRRPSGRAGSRRGPLRPGPPTRRIRGVRGGCCSVAGAWSRVPAALRGRARANTARTVPPRHLATCLGHGGDPAAAVAILEEVIRARADTGDEDVDVDALYYRRRLATWIGMAGDSELAATRLRDLTALSTRLRGPTDPMSLACRSRAAYWTAVGGEIDRAVHELGTVLQLLEAICGPTDQDTRTCREQRDHWRGITRDRTRHPRP